MKDLYYIDEPAAISFSGGRTSAYMLWKVLQAHGGVLPDYVHVTFANTGMEHESTLRFVQDCAENWNVPITWLELGSYEQHGVYASGSKEGLPRWKAATVVVDFETASRKGEPFERLVKKRRYLPNVMSRFCTADLKVRRIRDYLKGIGDDWTQFIGIRADEPRRAAKIHGTIDQGHELYAPLFLDGVTKQDVHAFWQAQDFDLALYSNDGTTDLGNCTLCFLKSGRKKISIIRENPSLANWWAEMEESMAEITGAGTAAYFRNDQPSYRQMQIIASDQGSFDFGQDDPSISCFCGE
jgi:3'-phosphoadenosine 5'-phosphosulfate sulfotransferase (PAPS reductase)/FAD synthetase